MKKYSINKILIICLVTFVLLVFIIDLAIFLNVYLNTKTNTNTTLPSETIEPPPSTELSILTTEDTQPTTEPYSQYVQEDAPLTFLFPNTIYDVGDCSFTLDKLEMVYQIYKSVPGSGTSYIKHLRIHVTVENQSSQQTTFSMKKPGTWIIGTYHSPEEEVSIGVNDNYQWKVNPEIDTAADWTIAPHQSKSICISGIYINKEELKYTALPYMDLFFVNNEEILTLSINQ